jgi:1,2-phenylacetyl-CoA epoxidase PaaB subunit
VKIFAGKTKTSFMRNYFPSGLQFTRQLQEMRQAGGYKYICRSKHDMVLRVCDLHVSSEGSNAKTQT